MKNWSEFDCKGAAIDALRNLAVVSETTFQALLRRVSVMFSQCCVCLQIFFKDGGTAFKLHRYRTESCAQFLFRGQRALKLLTFIGECWRRFAVQRSSFALRQRGSHGWSNQQLKFKFLPHLPIHSGPNSVGLSQVCTNKRSLARTKLIKEAVHTGLRPQTKNLLRGWDQNACELLRYKIWKWNDYVERRYTFRLSQTAVSCSSLTNWVYAPCRSRLLTQFLTQHFLSTFLLLLIANAT